jgi:very-short-patch-repair endonuclease
MWQLPDSGRGANELTDGPIRQWQEWWTQRAAACRGDAAAELAVRQGFVVTTGQLAALGWRDPDVRRMMRRRTWSRPARGTASPIVVPEEGDEYLTQRRWHALCSCAASLLRADHAVTGRSGAILHGLPTMAVPKLPILTAFDEETLGRRTGAHVRGATLRPNDLTTWFGTWVTTAPRVLVDLARLNRRDGIMAADAALREELVTRFAIDAALAEAVGWPGVRQAREVLRLADPLAESPLESITRLALHDDGFPAPRLQRWIGADRVDFYWPAHRFVLEADGRAKYRDDANWDEKKREQRLRAHSRQVRYIERVIWSDITENWPATSARLRPYFRFPASGVNFDMNF